MSGAPTEARGIPRPPLYMPSGLNFYRDCPQRYFLARIERRPDDASSAALERGRATHAVLAGCAEALRRGAETPTNLAARVAAALPLAAYPDRRAWAEDARVVLAQVGAGLAYLGQGARVLAVEQFYRFPYDGDARCPRFTLGAIADLVLADRDGEGREFVTVVDWKCGARKGIDLLQEVALRIVVRRALGHRYAYIVNTTVHLADGTRTSGIRDDATCQETFRTIRGLVAAIESDRVWAPLPGARCRWCPFLGNGCVLDQTVDTGDDDTARWLTEDGDGVADTGEPAA